MGREQLSVSDVAKFITFEGGEGAGKTTQIRRLSHYLQDRGQPVIQTREPGGSRGAEEIRKLLVDGDPNRWDAETEALLHSAARRDHLMKTITPALAAGTWVLCDRFADSTIAYQGYGHGVSQQCLNQLNALVSWDRRPDLTLVLDVGVDVGLSRAGGRAGIGMAEPEDRYERMGVAFHERLRAGFLEIAAAEPDRCVVLDAAQNEEDVFAEIKGVIEDRFFYMKELPMKTC